MNTPSTSISPGLGGFIAFFVLAVALWLLMRNMNARMRRMSYRAEEAQREAEAEADAKKRAKGRVSGEGDGPVEGPDGREGRDGREGPPEKPADGRPPGEDPRGDRPTNP